jgi:parallel beta-helix repeat protein
MDMDEHRLDSVARWFAAIDSRRTVARLLVALPLAGGLALLRGEASAAGLRLTASRAGSGHQIRGERKRKRKKGKKRKRTCAAVDQTPKRGRPCCQGLSQDGAGRCAQPPNCDVCPTGCRFASVQAAIDASAPGTTIRICAGTYFESITIARDLTLIGAGDGADPAGNTILQGPGSGRVVDITEPAATVALQGLRITGGATTDNGGGVRSRAGLLTMAGCTVTGNSAANAAGILNFGGDCTLIMSDCTVSANTVTGVDGNGGGIMNASGIAILTNCRVTGNTATSNGGGIFSGTSAASLTLIRTTVTGNHAGTEGGGIFNIGQVVCSNANSVTGNTADDPPVASNCSDAGGDGCGTCV